MKNPIKNALKRLINKPLTEEEKFIHLSTEEKLGIILGKYFYDRQANGAKNCDKIFNTLQETIEQEGDILSEAWEYAYKVISDFRENGAKVKGWR